MNAEKKYGVYVTHLNKLKEFQMSLLKKSRKIRRNKMKMIGWVTATVSPPQFFIDEPFLARLSVGDGKMFLEGGYYNGNFSFFLFLLLEEIVATNVTGDEAKFQFKPSSINEFCTLKFDDCQQISNLMDLLPPVVPLATVEKEPNQSESLAKSSEAEDGDPT